ncbi:hypothetical protein ACHAXA_003921 [Cyclostephanos tholiformis]|uniref:Uncharacterized protein n=1 Tax=Cyclostephanos tholiformis TaxID=382380 RepID=A0ABD3RFZ1_9STRA
MTTNTPACFNSSSTCLMSQMVAITTKSSQQSGGNYSLRPGGPQRRQHDSSAILSRMVTAQGTGVGNGATPFRVASMNEFRRSVHSLNTVHESSIPPPRAQQARNLTFAAVPDQSPSGTLPAVNPLLIMMEQRMAANASASTKEHTTPDSMAATSSYRATPESDDRTNMALHASIEKWAGISPGDRTDLMPSSIQSSAVAPLVASVQRSLTGRVPLSPKQIDLLKELTSPSQDDSLRQQLLVRQAHGADQSLPSHDPGVNSLHKTSNPQPCTGTDITRCAVSSAEVNRLRREKHSIQEFREILIQERMNEQANLQFIPRTVSGHQLQMSQSEIQKISFDALNKFKKSSSNNLNSIKPSQSSATLRKRCSKHDLDDSTVCTRDSVSSITPSQTSSASSSNKIHRSLSHCSARAALASKMEYLQLSQVPIKDSMQNQSFSSGQVLNRFSMQNQSFSSGLDACEHSSSSKLILTNKHFLSDPKTVTQQRLASKGIVNSSSNPLIGPLPSRQVSAGNAAVLFAMAVQNSRNSQMTPPKEHEGLVSTLPIKVAAEEYPPPAKSRTLSTNTETVIISAVPDSIKYLDVKADKKPLDIVKEALSSRGAKSGTKPSMEMEEGFFVDLTEMYNQEVVNAIRSNDVESLQKLHSDGANFQCGNRFGETLIHLACRRSTKRLVSFLLDEAGVSLRVRDDFGRTPLHDACWRAEPDLELLEMLIDREPELLMLSDKRGHTPLCYSRREHWNLLIPFLRDRSEKFRPVE